MAFCAIFAADTDSTWLLFGAFYLSLVSPARRWTLRWTPLVLTLSIVSFSASGAEEVSARLMAILGLVLGLCSIATIPRRGDGGWDKRYAALAAASLMCMASVASTLWPLHLAFAASRPDFEDLGRRLQAGYRMTRAERVGRFTIARAELRDGRPCLWMNTDPAGYSGFVRNPYPGVNPAVGLLPNTAFNLWSVVRLDRDWALISED
jgi:hypothetical protein